MNVIKRSMDCQHGVEPLSFFCDVLGADPGTDWMSFATSIDEDDFKPILCNPVEFAHALEKGMASMFTMCQMRKPSQHLLIRYLRSSRI